MLIRLLRRFLRPYRRPLVAVLVLQLGQALAALFLPSLNAGIIDRGIARGDRGYIWSTGVLMLGVSLLQISFAVAAVYFGSRVALGLARDLRAALFHQVTDFSSQEVGRFGAPSLITRITNDVQQVQLLVLMFTTMLIVAPIMAIGGVVMALREDVGLSAILAVSVPLLLICIGALLSRMVPQFRAMQTRIDAINRVMREQITGVRVVRAFVREPEETQRFEGVNSELTARSMSVGRIQAMMMPVVVLIVNASSVAAVWLGSGRIASGDMTVGQLIAFLSYLLQILVSVMMATWIAVLIPRAAVCADRIEAVLSTPPSVRVAAAPVTELVRRSTLELRDVGFHYPGAEAAVLEGISLVARPGQTTAVIGSTGAGKTTLVNLVARLADVTSGAVLIDDVDVRDLHPDVLWNMIGLVPQRPYLFTGTVASNLRYGRPDASDEQLWHALEVAQARDFVERMPGGLDASISQGGVNVSGGQRQRLAIARALVRRPEIYLFDDSFSALDLATDARLRAALAGYTGDATIVIVAQRVSTIMGADQILVLEDGCQVGLGTHAELLEQCPTYAEIVASQRASQESVA